MNGTRKRAMLVVALLFGRTCIAPLPLSAETVNKVDSTCPVIPLQASTRDFAASPKDVAAASTAALEQLGFSKPVISIDHGDIHVNATRVIRKIIRHFEGYTFTISRIRHARITLNPKDCSTAVNVSFDAAKITYDGGSLIVGDKAAPLAKFFDAVDHQLQAFQGSSGKKTWLDSCPKPLPLPVL